MQPIFLVDLDGSLFDNNNGGKPIATNSNGEMVGFMNEVQIAYLGWLMQSALVVPCTARGWDALNLVAINFLEHRICSNGATIINPDNTVNQQWADFLKPDLERSQADLHDLEHMVTLLSEQMGYGVQVDLVSDQSDLSAFLKVEQLDKSLSVTTPLTDAVKKVSSGGWHYVISAYWIKIFPNYLTKERAVKWYLKHLAPERSFAVGMGDSFNDLGFMNLCDYMITPQRSELAGLLGKGGVLR